MKGPSNNCDGMVVKGQKQFNCYIDAWHSSCLQNEKERTRAYLMPQCLAFALKAIEGDSGDSFRQTSWLMCPFSCEPSKNVLLLKRCISSSVEQRDVRGVSAGEITNQAELMAADKEERR